LVNTAFFVLPNWYNAKFLEAEVAQKRFITIDFLLEKCSDRLIIKKKRIGLIE